MLNRGTATAISSKTRYETLNVRLSEAYQSQHADIRPHSSRILTDRRVIPIASMVNRNQYAEKDDSGDADHRQSTVQSTEDEYPLPQRPKKVSQQSKTCNHQVRAYRFDGGGS